MDRVVIRGTGEKVPPLFEGKGNINGNCGKCGTPLVKNIWNYSISNIVIECPKCKSFDEIPSILKPEYNKVNLQKGYYSFSGSVKLQKRITVEGE